MGIVVDLQQAEDPRDLIHRAFQALAEGEVIAVPTETVYALVANALAPAAVARLVSLAQQFAGPNKQPVAPRLSLAVKSCDEALDYMCHPTPLALRLARRCWPGPVAIRIRCSEPESAVQQLPPDVRRHVVGSDGMATLRVPSHRIFQQLQQFASGPLLLATPLDHVGMPVITADPLRELADSSRHAPSIALVLDDGTSRYGGLETTVAVDANTCDVICPGVVEADAIAQFAQPMVLLVCTGNTCRSPMARVLMDHHLSSATPPATSGRPTSDRPASDHAASDGGPSDPRGRRLPVRVVSAGLAASHGSGASPEAIAAAETWGLDLREHESRPVSDSLVRHADLILTMTRSHRDSLLGRWPQATPRTFVLRGDGGDISDPIGSSLAVYRACASQMDRELQRWVESIGSDLETFFRDGQR
jgi:protein-tyrosine-phosphatase/tRNA A37 threonylcarbamoyladenosine synthetase subunit TsaC/SUA5/YrdC